MGTQTEAISLTPIAVEPAHGSDQHDPHLRFASVGKRYANGVDALTGIDLAVQRGEVFGIIGKSGAGKSSLLRTINRLEEPSSGQVLIDGVDIGAHDRHQLVALRRRIGMIFQHFNLLSAKTVRQNIELPLKVAGIEQGARRRKVDQLLALVDLTHKADAYPAQLSGGQKQRVGIARALVHDPEILLCDEATSALDPQTTEAILVLLRDINRKLGLTIVLITHEMAVIRQVCDRVVVLDAGRVVEQGPVWQVFGAPRHSVTRSLLAPLRQDVPEELAHRLRTGTAPAGAAQVLRLSIDGSDRAAPDLSALFQALGGQVSLLQGGVDCIAGRHLGQLLLAVRHSPLTTDELGEAAGCWAQRVEVLGHVA